MVSAFYRSVRRIVLLSVFAWFVQPLQAATITWNGLGNATSWHDLNNWDLLRVPGAGDDVVVPNLVLLDS